MKSSTQRATGIVATLIAMSLALYGCSSDDSGSSATSSNSAAASSAKTTSKAAQPSKSKLTPRTSTPAAAQSGANPTIADYIADNDITETPIKPGDAGAPTIDLPFPDGWENAGDETPDWAYGAIIYTGPEAADYTPSITAVVSRLDGDVDPQKILDYASGELQNLPGYTPLGNGATSELSGFPAYQLGGTFEQDGQTKVVAQKTVVIAGSDGLYVLQLNADGTEDQLDIVNAAADAIDAQTKITP